MSHVVNVLIELWKCLLNWFPYIQMWSDVVFWFNKVITLINTTAWVAHNFWHLHLDPLKHSQ